MFLLHFTFKKTCLHSGALESGKMEDSLSVSSSSSIVIFVWFGDGDKRDCGLRLKQH